MAGRQGLEQIQSSFEHSPNQRVQRLSAATHGQVRQNPQCSRNENRPQVQQSEIVKERATPSAAARASQRFTVLNDVDLEEDTLP
jgi:hypothetical protein